MKHTHETIRFNLQRSNHNTAETHRTDKSDGGNL